ncbi:MAG: signal peptidase I [bacterium]|nr:signal peptidase I [bacterium]
MEEKKKKILLWLLDLGINIAIIIILVLVIQNWIIAPFDVSGSSMCDTLNYIDGECKSGYGEKIIINEATYVFNDPERGDVVVFKSPGTEDKYFIKRIIGVPGDTLEIKEGDVYINDVKLKETYLNSTNRGNTKSYFSDFNVFNVPEDKYFLMGDNRNSSRDARTCFRNEIDLDCKNNPDEAFVEKSEIRGKAWVVWWPLSNIKILSHHKYFELELSEDQENSESLAEK